MLKQNKVLILLIAVFILSVFLSVNSYSRHDKTTKGKINHINFINCTSAVVEQMRLNGKCSVIFAVLNTNGKVHYSSTNYLDALDHQIGNKTLLEMTTAEFSLLEAEE